jgi:alpha-beta hydrolase superfamily lysophospholipase
MTDHTDHPVPAGLLTRGTVVVVPGRGETRDTYGRLGRRLAADAYRVRVLDAPAFDDPDPAAALAALGRRLAGAVEDTAGEDRVARPVVLVGADSGAAAVAALLGGSTGSTGAPGDFPRPDAVILAGLPGHSAAVGTWDEELDVRTSCPTHRGTLTEDSGVRRGALGAPLPRALLTAAQDSDLGVPALFLVGDADPLADRAALTRTAKSQERARLAVVRGAHHDVLNDLQHRSVAAEIVGFLEALRNGLTPLVAVETSSW